MYFPLLRNLNNYKVDTFAINAMDSWLAIQRKAVLNNLSPLRFSGQSDIDLDLAIDMFLIASRPEVGVLKVKYRILCPRCNSFHKVIHSLDELTNEDIECSKCEHIFNSAESLDSIEMAFERIMLPQRPLVTPSISAISNPQGGNLGKGSGLRVSDVIKPDNARRQYLLNLDTRFEAAQ